MVLVGTGYDAQQRRHHITRSQRNETRGSKRAEPGLAAVFAWNKSCFLLSNIFTNRACASSLLHTSPIVGEGKSSNSNNIKNEKKSQFTIHYIHTKQPQRNFAFVSKGHHAYHGPGWKLNLLNMHHIHPLFTLSLPCITSTLHHSSTAKLPSPTFLRTSSSFT